MYSLIFGMYRNEDDVYNSSQFLEESLLWEKLPRDFFLLIIKNYAYEEKNRRN